MATALDVASMMHGIIVVRLVLCFDKHTRYWDARWAHETIGFTDQDVWNDFTPVMICLVPAWLLAILASWRLWLRVLETAPLGLSARVRGRRCRRR